MAARGKSPANEPQTDLHLLDDLLREVYQRLTDGKMESPKIGDFIKMIELRRKLTPQDATQKELWAALEKVRRDVLASRSPSDLPVKKTTKPKSRAK